MVASPKHCIACQKQGICVDTRKHPNHVRRRYECKCGKRWSTHEMMTDKIEALRGDLRLSRERFESAEAFELRIKKLFGALLDARS